MVSTWSGCHVNLRAPLRFNRSVGGPLLDSDWPCPEKRFQIWRSVPPAPQLCKALCRPNRKQNPVTSPTTGPPLSPHPPSGTSQRAPSYPLTPQSPDSALWSARTLSESSSNVAQPAVKPTCASTRSEDGRGRDRPSETVSGDKTQDRDVRRLWKLGRYETP